MQEIKPLTADQYQDLVDASEKTFPQLKEMRTRANSAISKLRSTLYDLVISDTLVQEMGEDFESSFRGLLEIFKNDKDILGVYVSNPEDSESTFGLGTMGPIVYLHSKINKLLSPAEIIDIRRMQYLECKDADTVEKRWLDKTDLLREQLDDALVKFPFNE